MTYRQKTNFWLEELVFQQIEWFTDWKMCSCFYVLPHEEGKLQLAALLYNTAAASAYTVLYVLLCSSSAVTMVYSSRATTLPCGLGSQWIICANGAAHGLGQSKCSKPGYCCSPKSDGYVKVRGWWLRMQITFWRPAEKGGGPPSSGWWWEELKRAF